MLTHRLRAVLPWCAPVAILAGVLAGVAIVRSGSGLLFATVLAALALVPAGWVLVSTLWPARAERGCPACGRPALARLDPGSAHGLVCRACGWRDESQSAWLLAEEEGDVQELVLARRRPRAPAVDTSTKGG